MSIWDQWLKSTDPAIQAAFNRVQGTQQYLQLTPAYQNTVHDILWKYGVDPGGMADMAGISMDFTNDPYSIVNLLKKTHSEADHSTFNAANQAGLEESGAAVGALNANNEAYKQGYGQALASATGEVNTATGQYTTGVGNIFDTLEKAPATIDPVAEAAPGPQAVPTPLPIGQPTGVGTGTPTPQGPYIRTGPEAGSTVAKKLVTTPPARGGQAVAVKPPAVKKPGFSGKAL